MSEEILHIYKIWTADDGSTTFVLIKAQSAGHARRIAFNAGHAVYASEFVAPVDQPGIFYNTEEERFGQ